MRRYLVFLGLAGLLLSAAILPASLALAEETPAEKALSPNTIEALEARIQASPALLWIVSLVKFGPPLIGLVLLVLWGLRQEKRRLGLLPPVQARTPTMPFDLAWTGALILAAIAIPVLAHWMLHYAPGHSGERVEPDLTESLIFTALGSLPIAAFVIGRRWRLARPAPPRALPALSQGLWVFSVASVFILPAMLVVGLLLKDEARLQDLVVSALDDRQIAWKVLVFGVLVAPLGEEALFRGLLYPALRNAFGDTSRAAWASAVVTSLLFAAIHENLLAALPLFILAMFLARLMEKTNSLLACVVAHAVHNGLSMIPILVLSQPA